MMLTMLNIWRMENIDQQISTLNTSNRQTLTLVGFPNTSCMLSQVTVSSGDPTHIVRSAVPLSAPLSGVCISQNVSSFVLLISKIPIVILNLLI